MLGFNYNLNYYICTGQDPHTPSAPTSVGRAFTYDAFVLLPAVSAALHVFVFARIFCFRRNNSSRGCSTRRKNNNSSSCALPSSTAGTAAMENSSSCHEAAAVTASSPTAEVKTTTTTTVSSVLAAVSRGDAGERNRNVADLCARYYREIQINPDSVGSKITDFGLGIT